MNRPPRRVVTGHVDGRSVVLSDETIAAKRTVAARRGCWYDIWNTSATPAPISASEPDPATGPFKAPPEPNGSVIRIAEYGPGAHERESVMHRTQTIDYAIVLEGELVMRLDDGVEVHLAAGDVVVQRGTNHTWVNRSQSLVRIAYILLDGRFSDDLRQEIGAEALSRVVLVAPVRNDAAGGSAG